LQNAIHDADHVDGVEVDNKHEMNVDDGLQGLTKDANWWNPFDHMKKVMVGSPDDMEVER
jgi:hypothetical protein